MTPRPRLRTTYRPLERGPDEVQLGTGEDALVLTGLPPALAATLHRLDGVTPLPVIEAGCREQGLGAHALDDFLALLADAGALDLDGPSHQGHHRTIAYEQVDALAAMGLDDLDAYNRLLRARRTSVAVVGTGPLAEQITAALGEVADQLLPLAPPGRGRPIPHADIVVLVSQEATDPGLAAQAVLSGACLPVVARARSVVIGPWHERDDEPCPVCLDLRRGDSDAAWPHLLDQLCAPDPHRRLRSTDPVGRALAAALTSQWVRRRVAGLLDQPGLTCEVDPWQMGMTHRVWPVHPRCSRHESTPSPAPRAHAVQAAQAAQATMSA